MAIDVSKLTPDQKKAIQDKLAKLSPEQLQDLVKKQCVFCKIAKGEVPSKVIYEDANTMAILDAKPATPGHILVFPKEHYSVLQQMPDADVARLFALAKYVSTASFDATQAQGSNILVASGAIAGQGAPHVIVHVIPRFENDGLPSQFWEPKELEEEQMNEIQKRISEKLKDVKITSSQPSLKKSGGGEKVKGKAKRVRRPKAKPLIP